MTRGGVGKSPRPCPKLIPPRRSHSLVIRRGSEGCRLAMRLAMGKFVKGLCLSRVLADRLSAAASFKPGKALKNRPKIRRKHTEMPSAHQTIRSDNRMSYRHKWRGGDARFGTVFDDAGCLIVFTFPQAGSNWHLGLYGRPSEWRGPLAAGGNWRSDHTHLRAGGTRVNSANLGRRVFKGDSNL